MTYWNLLGPHFDLNQAFRRVITPLFFTVLIIHVVEAQSAATDPLRDYEIHTPEGSYLPKKVQQKPVARVALLEKVIATFEGRLSIAAKISLRVDLFDVKFFGSGSYFEQRSGPYPLLRQELKIQIGDQANVQVNVGDGRFFWSYSKLGEKEKLYRVDIEKVDRALQQQGNDSDLFSTMKFPPIEGLSKLFRGINRYFYFTDPEPIQLKTKRGLLPAWKLTGQWKPDQLAKLLPELQKDFEQGKPLDLDKIPHHLPDQIILCIGREDLFPYRMEYLRSVEPEDRKDKNNSTTKKKILVSIQLYEVNLNVPIDPTFFKYNTGLKPIDRTRAYLKSLLKELDQPDQ